jgi:hypothetical protein
LVVTDSFRELSFLPTDDMVACGLRGVPQEYVSTINSNPVTRKKEMSMPSKSDGNIITEPQATTTLLETGEVQ